MAPGQPRLHICLYILLARGPLQGLIYQNPQDPQGYYIASSSSLYSSQILARTNPISYLEEELVQHSKRRCYLRIYNIIYTSPMRNKLRLLSRHIPYYHYIVLIIL